MAINRRFFMSYVGLHLFDGSVSASQSAGLTAILDRWESQMAQSDDRWLAYMLGTAHHETGRTMQPVRETLAQTDERAIAILERSWKAGRMPWVSLPYWRKDAAGKSWLGRGLVQLTHKANYQTMAKDTGTDLVSHPELAMQLGTAVSIMFDGMIRGLFTGKRLEQYFSSKAEDWRNARRIINGLDRADLVASYGKSYYAAISYNGS